MLSLISTYEIIHGNKKFKMGVDICIGLNCIVFMFYYEGQSKQYERVLQWLNNFFVFVFVFEQAVKIIVYKKIYFKIGWNCFEFLLISLCMVGVMWKESSADTLKQQKEMAFIFKLLQVLLAIRLIKSIRFLSQTFATLFYVLPSISPVAALFGLVVYIFALLGNTLFPFLKHQTYMNGYDLSFSTFPKSIFSLFRVASGEQWFQLVGDVVRLESPNFTCRFIDNYQDFSDHGYDGCGQQIGYLFFFIFHLFVSIIILNLFIALLLSATLESIQLENQAVSYYQLSDIIDLWYEYDEYAYGFINYKDFWKFSSQIAMIYKVKQDELTDVQHKKVFLKLLNIPIYENTKISLYGYKFHDVILKMTQFSLYIKFGTLKSAVKDTENTNKDFIKTDYLSGDMANIILMQRKIKAWCIRSKSNNQQILPVEQKVSKAILSDCLILGNDLLQYLFENENYNQFNNNCNLSISSVLEQNSRNFSFEQSEIKVNKEYKKIKQRHDSELMHRVNSDSYLVEFEEGQNIMSQVEDSEDPDDLVDIEAFRQKEDQRLNILLDQNSQSNSDLKQIQKPNIKRQLKNELFINKELKNQAINNLNNNILLNQNIITNEKIKKSKNENKIQKQLSLELFEFEDNSQEILCFDKLDFMNQFKDNENKYSTNFVQQNSLQPQKSFSNGIQKYYDNNVSLSQKINLPKALLTEGSHYIEKI